MQAQYFISKDGQDLGPWSLDQLVEHLASFTVAPTDYVFDEAKQDWVLIMEFAPVNERLKGKKPKAPPKVAAHQPASDVATAYGTNAASAKGAPHPEASSASTVGSVEWFVLKWDNRYGPFSYDEVLKMLQEKNIFEFDYIWRNGFDGWLRIAEIGEFSPDHIRGLSKNSGKASEDVFYRRRHQRAKHNASIVVHDGQNVWKGTSLEISEGGAGLVMHNSLILPGQKVYLHFKPGDNVPPFNALCEIVSKQYVKGVKSKDTAIGYGVKFLEISGDVQKFIRKVAGKPAA